MLSERFYECLECHEAIFNPICPFCLTKHIEAWLSGYPTQISNKLLPALKRYIRKTNSLAGRATECIKCKKKRASLCPYCFTSHVLDELKSMNVSRVILKEFLQLFNFDFEHTGYSKEAERLGVI